MVKLYGIYKQTSDLADLPDDVLALCDSCAAAPSSRLAIELDPTDAPCCNCSN